MSEADPIVIVGAGLAGLSCARELSRRGRSILVLDAAAEVGGRVRTRRVDGFLIDAGFQVLQLAYPEAQRQLDYAALKLRRFQPGALIRTQGRFLEMADPWRRPQAAFRTLFNGIGTLADRLRLGRLRASVMRGTVEQLLQADDMPLADYLRQQCHFSDDFIRRFLQPWFAGVFLEPDLCTSSTYFRFLFRMFAGGDVAVPALGMQEIPKQLAGGINPAQIRLSTVVERVSSDHVVLAGGERIAAAAVVLAVAGSSAAQLAGEDVCPAAGRGTVCLQFAAPQAPVEQPVLLLNGDGPAAGPVNNVCVMSNVAADYAPSGQALVSVSTCGVPEQEDEELEAAVRVQLEQWFGNEVVQWQLLASDRIRFALPVQPPGLLQNSTGYRVTSTGIYCCGDSYSSGSIHGAMQSGRLLAEKLATSAS